MTTLPPFLIPDMYACKGGIVSGIYIRACQTIHKNRANYDALPAPEGCGEGCTCKGGQL
jgi:hypothetical protein